MTTLYEELKSRAPEWEEYTKHEFVEKLGDGTLPLEAFQDYLVQDYLFLVHFARAHALAAFKSRRLSEIEAVSTAMSGIIDETKLHRKLTAEWGISEDELDRAPEKMGTVAYTRYVIDTGLAGDVLELQIALAPCQIGYAEIGTYLAPRLEGREDHPYSDWITTYAAEDFQGMGQASIETLDRLAEMPAEDLVGTPRFERLLDIFRTASRLERDFWQQALDSVGSAHRIKES